MNLFKFDKINCIFSTGENTTRSFNPLSKTTPRFIMNNYNEKYINECKEIFNTKQDMYEICITIKPSLLDKNKITTKTHLEIYNLIEKKIRIFLKKNKLITTRILLITEYSQALRLHFHGIIIKPFSPEMGQLLMTMLNKYIGRTIIKRVNSKNYFDYIIKDVKKDYDTIPTMMTINFHV